MRRPPRRRGIALLALALLLLFVVADAVVVLANRPDQDEDAAASAGFIAVFDTDPNPGENLSCEFDPDIGLVLLKAGYDCIGRDCSEEFARVRVTHDLLDGWSFRITSGGQLGMARSGSTFPNDTDPSAVDPDDCR